MPIDTQCEHCGFAYVSKDEMAGKKVRCRNCGQIFTIRDPRGAEDASGGSFAGQTGLSAADEPFGALPPIESSTPVYENNSDETRQMPAVTKYESNMAGGIGSAKSRMERTGEAEMLDFVGPQPGDLTRPSVPFRFPYAGDLDAWLPRIVPLAMLAWFFYVLWSWRPDPDTADTYPTWAGLIPVGLLLILFLIVWTPIFAGAMRKVATTLKFSLPSRRFVRAMCLASLPFGLGGTFWLAGESLVTMGIGMFIGAALAAPAAWFLYRLRETEIAHAAFAAAFATVLSAGLTLGLFWGGNYVLNRALDSSGKATMFAESPMGPNLPWESTTSSASASSQQRSTFTPPSTRRIAPGDTPIRPVPTVPETPAPATPGDVTPLQDTANTQQPGIPMPPPGTPAPRDTTPPSAPAAEKEPFANHPIFSRGEYLPIQQQILDVVYPLTPSNYMAVVSPSSDPNIHEVWRYTIEPFAQQSRAPAPFAQTVTASGYALSPNGQFLVRVTRFGEGAALQVYDFEQSRIIDSQPLPERPGQEPRLLGFVDEKNLLLERRNTPNSAPYELGTINLSTMQYTAYANSEDNHSEVVALTPDRSVAAVGASGGRVTLRFWNPKQKEDTANSRTRIFLMGHRGAFDISPTGIAAQPVAAPGPAMKPEGRLAITYEDNRQLQLIVCDRSVREGPVLIHFLPALPVRMAPRGRWMTNRLTWLPGGDIVVYGQFCIDTISGNVVGTMDTAPVIGQQLVGDHAMHFIVSTPQGTRVLQAALKSPTTRPAAEQQ